MIRVSLGVILAMGLGGAALAQSTASGSAEVTDNPNSSVVQPGIARPPSGHRTQKPAKQRPGISPILPNDPTLPQVALHPTATIGSPVPIAGPGGTTQSPTGQ
ncbi:MAG TPA: hypothetical protein VMH92_01185 [Acidocella sp.]|nr:hypothetical protein [Acidocella sp.]